jgi:hypothetical protein
MSGLCQWVDVMLEYDSFAYHEIPSPTAENVPVQEDFDKSMNILVGQPDYL